MREIKLTKGAVALVSDEDYERVAAYKWYLHSDGYAVRTVVVEGRKVKVLMHRFIMEAAPGEEIDHINGNRLDNRRENLRRVNRTHNNANSRPRKGRITRYKGIDWREDKQKMACSHLQER